MRAAPGPRHSARLLVIDPSRGHSDAHIADLPAFLRACDVLVLNDAATLPASLRTDSVELRLLRVPDTKGEAPAVVFGAGDWRTPTERRPAPPSFQPGDRIGFDGLEAEILDVDPGMPRLLTVRFDRTGPALVHALYERGRPIQYSYLRQDLPLVAVQTPFAGRPWAVEMPSAGRALTAPVLAEARARGIVLATLTHAAGISSIGDAEEDARLPLPERYDIPQATVAAIGEAQARGGRVIAVGTTVARALEGCARTHGQLVAGEGETDVILDAGFERRVIDALVSGMHAPGESHYRVLAALAPDHVLRAAVEHAEANGYLAHEMGDATLVLEGALAAGRRAA